MITIRELGGVAALRRELNTQWTAERSSGRPDRKVAFTRRLKVDKGQHASLILQRVYEAYQSQAARESLSKHISTKRNVQRQIVDSIATLYNTPPTRTLRGATPVQAAAFAKAYKAAGVDQKMEAVGRYAMLCNVVHMLARYERGQIRLIEVLPDCCDVVFDPAGVDDSPSILVYATRSHGAAWVAVDAERWYWITSSWVELMSEPHGLGRRPWATFRWRAPTPGEYWDHELGQELTEGTVDIGRMSAHMEWVRKIRAMALVVQTAGTNDPLPSAQHGNGEEAILLRGSSIVGMEVLDPETPPENFLRDIDAATKAIADLFGLSLAAGGPEQTSAVDPGSSQSKDALANHRLRQTKHFVAGEVELAVLVASLMRREGLLDIEPERVGEMLRVRYGSRTPADKNRAEAAKAQMKLGATSKFKYYRQEHPELTEDEAREEVLENIAEEIELADYLVTRNLSLDDEGQIETLAQQQGRLGGQMSGATRGQQAKAKEDTDAP